MNLGLIANEPACSMPAAASIVHDLRNPLCAIHGSAEMLMRSGLSEAQVNRIARNMYCASVRMKELLDEFMSRYEGPVKQTNTPLHELVAAAMDRVALAAETQSVQIVENVPQHLAIVLDRHRIQRALVNLLVNALEVMPNGGTIRISAIAERSSVLIKVRDTGPGIAPEIRDRLFQPFATAGKVGGLGLGLAFSREAVAEHGGEIWAESSHYGACFAIRLPRTIQCDPMLTPDGQECAAPVEQ